MGFRTEEMYGEGYRDADEIMAHEIFDLANTDILETLVTTIFDKTPLAINMQKIIEHISGKPSDPEIELFVESAFNDNKIAKNYCSHILDNIEMFTGKKIKYALWLCDSIDDIITEYSCENTNTPFTQFDEYTPSTIILSDLGKGGKLYGYETNPTPIKHYNLSDRKETL